jgi:XTP/dITP diphosphohydrolase
MKQPKLLVASTNSGKVSEISDLLKSVHVEVLGLNDLNPPIQDEVLEDGETFKDNAIKKATEYGKLSGILTICDDSGLEVDALNGKPGVRSKRFGNTDEERISKLIELMEKIPENERSARFISVVAVYDPRDERVYTSMGICEGKIENEAIGNNGFGYDPVFYSTEIGKTFATATSEEKNAVSHRGKALRQIKPVLMQLLD